MKTTSQSDYGKIKSIYIKNVDEAFVNEATVDQQWKELNFLSKPDLFKAREEYKKFEVLLKSNGAELHYLPQDNSVSIDSIYCRDAAIATDYGVIICNMGKAARANEPEAERKMFTQKGMKILGSIVAPGTLEGGDVAWLDERTLAVGHTYRTNEKGIQQLKALLNPFGVNVITVSLPHYKGPSDVFHLMSILSPVDKDLAVVYSPLMPSVFRKELLSRGFDLVEVPEDEFDSMGCNVLAIAPRTCIMVAGNPKTKAALEKAGCTVFEYEGNEIVVLQAPHRNEIERRLRAVGQVQILSEHQGLKGAQPYEEKDHFGHVKKILREQCFLKKGNFDRLIKHDPRAHEEGRKKHRRVTGEVLEQKDDASRSRPSKVGPAKRAAQA